MTYGNDPFLESREWRVVRMRALERDGARCAACGRTAADGIVINVDHIKPRSRFPELALDVDNLQVLCAPCNHGKGNTSERDWRKSGVDNYQRERMLLGIALIDNETIVGMSDFVFSKPEHRLIFACINEIFEATGSVDVISAHEWLIAQDELEHIGGLAYLGACVEAAPVAA